MIEDHRKKLGKFGEQFVEKYLEGKQYFIRERNFRSPYGEIDLIAENETFLVFIEVKTRSKESLGGIAGCITPKKKEHLIHTAQFYLVKHPCEKEIRFDVAYLKKSGIYFQLEYIDFAFIPED